MAAPVAVTRAQVLARRVAAQGLDRSSADPAVLDLGVQDTPPGSAVVALAARGASARGLVTVWSVRGAPHLHRPGDLAALAGALWPADDADATARLASSAIREGARLGLAAFVTASRALRDAVDGTVSKGEASRAVSDAVPSSLTFWCETCGARHVSGALFQQAGLFGSVQVGREGRRTVLSPLAERHAVPEAAAGTGDVVRGYVRLLGPAGPAEVARFLGTRPAAVRKVWPDGLAEVSVDGVRAWLPESELAALRSAVLPDPGRLVRLLPPGDPYLQARDRELLVPDPVRRKELWRAIGSPGAVLAGSEVVGTWRARAAGAAVDVEVALPARPAAGMRRRLEEQAAVVAGARGAAEARLRLVEPD
ncbi:DNA glycosylase AlkZ-like family protein [Streptomyces sp. ODS05-4]|uniref:DNA glycosylase AlkZ-like family protein n=1 Tax=Streptomyces sp. ODS05-4 TaxID=2944939 RepID=UPI0027E50713|nr:crosslink repair DNA glycosylase YcaQ family protein [Streptomyces sp. ODS05-4]